MKKLINLSCFLMLFVFQTKANIVENEPKFEVKVSKTSVLLGNYIEVTFTLKNAGGNKFEAPNFEGFDIIGGPNQSSSYSIMNGVTTQSVSYSYYVKPRDIGNIFVSPAYIEVDGKVLETLPIEILVMDNPEGIIEKPQRQSPNRMDMFQFPNDDFFNFPNPDDFFNLPKKEAPKQGEKKKKKRKIYKI